MRASVFTEILSGVDGLNLDDTAKRAVRAMVQNIGRQHGVKRVEKDERIEFASSLLIGRVSRTTIAERLKARFDISREQAYRDIRAALQLCQRSAAIATNADHNEASDGAPPLLAVHGGK